MMQLQRIGLRAGIVLGVASCAVSLATPGAVAHRTATHAPPPTGNIANGFRVFNDYFCSACHVMKAAGPDSYRGYNVCGGDPACSAGVNFNRIRVPYQAAIAVVASGLPAAPPQYVTQMPPFRKVLTKAQIRDVAAFVAKYSGGYKTCTECKGVAKD
jgi:mono/diheme cytochrome c family protein